MAHIVDIDSRQKVQQCCCVMWSLGHAWSRILAPWLKFSPRSWLFKLELVKPCTSFFLVKYYILLIWANYDKYPEIRPFAISQVTTWGPYLYLYIISLLYDSLLLINSHILLQLVKCPMFVDQYSHKTSGVISHPIFGKAFDVAKFWRTSNYLQTLIAARFTKLGHWNSIEFPVTYWC